MTHGPAIKPSGLPSPNSTGMRIFACVDVPLAARDAFSDAPINALNSGCGSSGFDLNSGWNWQPRYHGWFAISQISTYIPSGVCPVSFRPFDW